MSDAINPDHYKRLPAEAIKIIEAAIQNAPDNIAAYNHGQQLKYDLRLFEKGKTLREYLIDQEKHCWYSDRLREHLRKLVEQEDKYEQQKAADQQSLKDHPFGNLKKAHLNSDTIPEGYRKLKDSHVEPRELGDLRWSVSQKRYVEITVEEIGYANRDNWAACRKVAGEVTVEVTVEVTGEVTGEVKPPDGWRWLEVGEVIRKGDQGFENGMLYAIKTKKIGMTLQSHWMPTIRRNRFEVGEKVVHGDCKSLSISVVENILGDGWVNLVRDGVLTAYHVKDLSPYIEEAT